jgi:hypothetical protein
MLITPATSSAAHVDMMVNTDMVELRCSFYEMVVKLPKQFCCAPNRNGESLSQ